MQITNSVDIEAIELRIFDPAASDAIIDEFYRFGQILFSECLQRSSELDRKLTNMLGWSTAALAFLLVNQSKALRLLGMPGKAAIAIASVSALASVLISSFALKTRMWPAPSEKDWFKTELWDDPSWLKRYHVVSLLLSHQIYTRSVARKADCLKFAELMLPISALAISAILLLS